MTADLIACPTCDMLHTLVADPDRRPAALPPLPHRAPDQPPRRHRAHAGRRLRQRHPDARRDLLPVPRALDRRPAQERLAPRRRARLPQRPVAPLSVATTLLIVVLPLLRASALAYTLLPLRLGRPPAPGAERAFRLAEHLRPWAMSEVFLIGVVVALVKIGGLASISLGPAFWAMAALVMVVVWRQQPRRMVDMADPRPLAPVLTARGAGLSRLPRPAAWSRRRHRRLPALRHRAPPAASPSACSGCSPGSSSALSATSPPTSCRCCDPHPRPRERQHHRRRRHRALPPRRLGHRHRRLRRQRGDPDHQVRGHHLPRLPRSASASPSTSTPASTSTRRSSSSAAGR